VTVNAVADGNVTLANVSLEPSEVATNTTNEHTLTFDALGVSDDGDTDTFDLAFPEGTLNNAGSVSVVDANDSDVSLSGGPDVSGDNVTFDISPDSNATTRDVTVTANVTVDAPATNTTADITIDVVDSSTGEDSAAATLTVVEADAPPETPEERALAIAGVDDPAQLTQDDVTAAITRFNRGESVNGLTIEQDDVTAVITLFERN